MAVRRIVSESWPSKAGAGLPPPRNPCSTAIRSPVYATARANQVAMKLASLRRGGTGRTPASQAHAISPGATAPFSLLSTPAAIAAALHATLPCSSAAYTASKVNTAAISSFRPTTYATASTCTGWTANTTPATSPAVSPAQRQASAATNTLAATCHIRFTAWNQAVERMVQSSA